MDNKELVTGTGPIIGTEPDQINHIYIQAESADVLKRIYIRYNDGYVERLEISDGVSQAEFKKGIAEWFKELKVSTVPGRDFHVALKEAKIFKELDAKVEEQQKEAAANLETYDFTPLSEIEEVSNIKLAPISNFESNSYKIETELNDLENFEDLPEAEPKTIASKKDLIENDDFDLSNGIDDDNDKKAKMAPELKKRLILTGGTIGLAIALASCTYANKDALKASIIGARNAQESNIDDEDITRVNFESIENNESAVASNYAAADVEKASLEGQDYEFYVTVAPEGLQKDTMAAYHDYVMEFNRSEDWMYQELTEDMIKELEKASITVDGNEAIFGFTAEELHALNLVYGTHTNDEYVTLVGGKQIDITKVISSSESEMNGAIRNAIIYYLNSDNSSLGIEKVVNFTEDEVAQIQKFEGMLQEYKTLLNDNKAKEAEAKMKEIKVAFLEYAHADDIDVNNAKPWILRTLLPVCSIYSTSYQYKDTITLNLYDTKTSEYVDKEVKTWLFDEITMRDLVEGYVECEGQEAFDQIEFLKQFNINSSRYTLVISDNGVSRADEYIGGLVNKLEEANSYTEKLEEKNLTSDAAYLGGGGNADNSAYLNNNSEYDKLTHDSYNDSEVLELIDNDLKLENKYPKNQNFFTSMYSKFTQKILEFKNAIAKKFSSKSSTKTDANVKQVTQIVPPTVTYVPGQTYTETTTETYTETYTDTHTEYQAVSQEEIAQEDKVNSEKAVEEALKTKVVDGDTGKEKPTTYQDIYNNAVNNGTDGKTNLDTNLDANDKTNQNDPLVQKVEKWAQEDAAQINKEHEDAKNYNGGAKEIKVDEQGNTHYISGGDIKSEEGYKVEEDKSGNITVSNEEGKKLDTVTESEAEAYNRRLAEQKAQEAAQESNNSNTSEYTTEDPTQSETFAPVLEESKAVEVAPAQVAAKLMNAAPVVEASVAAPVAPTDPVPVPSVDKPAEETPAPVVEETTQTQGVVVEEVAPSAVEEVMITEEAGSGEYTTEDPTLSMTFAPVYEEDIDAIIESLATEAPAEEASNGMSR